MKFIPLCKSEEIPDKTILKDEFAAAVRVGEGRLGKEHFFYRYFINVRYTAYQKIKKAYLREESGESGEFLLKEFYLMLQFADGTEGKLRFERKERAGAVLAYLETHYPGIEIGYKKPEKTI